MLTFSSPFRFTHQRQIARSAFIAAATIISIAVTLAEPGRAVALADSAASRPAPANAEVGQVVNVTGTGTGSGSSGTVAAKPKHPAAAAVDEKLNRNSSDAARYATREKSSKNLETFRGGDSSGFYIGSGTLIIVLLVVILVILL